MAQRRGRVMPVQTGHTRAAPLRGYDTGRRSARVVPPDRTAARWAGCVLAAGPVDQRAEDAYALADRVRRLQAERQADVLLAAAVRVELRPERVGDAGLARQVQQLPL